MPAQAVTEHGVDECQQFTHARDEDDLCAFALLFEPLGEALDDRIAPGGGEAKLTTVFVALRDKPDEFISALRAIAVLFDGPATVEQLDAVQKGPNARFGGEN